MVGASDIAFRLLMRRKGADCTYTEMALAGQFCEDQEYREEFIMSCREDRPLVLQLAGNDPKLLGRATRLAANSGSFDAVDLNLGCPQTKAKEQVFGSYLLDPEHRSLVLKIVSKMIKKSKGLPIFVKIRISEDIEDSICLCKDLENAGVSLIAVHGRTRGTPKRRRSGPADLEAIRRIVQACRIPILSNGNVRTREDIVTNLDRTGAYGAMCAEALLENPGLFQDKEARSWDVGQSALEYIELAREWPPGKVAGGMQCVRGHITWMLGKRGRGAEMNFKYAGAYRHCIPDLRRTLLEAESLSDFEAIIQATLLWDPRSPPPPPVSLREPLICPY